MSGKNLETNERTKKPSDIEVKQKSYILNQVASLEGIEGLIISRKILRR